MKSRSSLPVPFPPRPSSAGVHFKKTVSDSGEITNRPQAKSPTLRQDWPFLSDPGCPPELKILAANKITAYHSYRAAHAQLFDCTSLHQQFTTVKQLVESFIENRIILDEFQYYMKHGHVLGDHPIFKEYDEIRNLRRLSGIDLFKKQQQLEHNIWRIESQLAKGDRPDLRIQREQRLQHKKNLLAEVERLLR